MIAEELVAVLGFKIEGQDKLKKFKGDLDNTEKSAEASTARMRKLGMAAGAVTTAAVAIGAKGYKEFAGFEREMTRIGITAGATAEETATAGKAVQDLALGFALPIAEAISGLDTLTASGMDLKEAMGFLPSVLATAQASGTASSDIANTIQKVASALKLEASEAGKAFDIMVTGGKAGQFELNEMAAYIPTLANSFANLGYEGEDGLKNLIALLQTLREDTGSSAQAATQAQNIFAKMFSTETEKNFGKFGVNVREEMQKAAANGEQAVDAYVRLSRQVMADNPDAKIVDLFADQEFQLGMQSLMSSQESFQKFLDTVNSAEVDGAVFADLNRVMADSQSNLDRLSVTWGKFMTAVGERVAPTANAVLDSGISFFERDQKIDDQLKKEGKSWFERNILTIGGAREEAYQRSLAGASAPIREIQAEKEEKSSSAWEKFFFGSLADGKSFKEAMSIETGSRARIAQANLERTGADAAATAIASTTNDNRDQSIKVEVGGVHVQQASQAPAAVGAAVGNAAAGAAKSGLPPTRMTGIGSF